MISQSGGLGFAFFDRARPRNFRFRYVVTTGNEAVLESADFIDYMLDEGETDVFLLLIERRRAGKIQARCGKGAQGWKTADRAQDRAIGAGEPRGCFAHRGAAARRLPTAPCLSATD